MSSDAKSGYEAQLACQATESEHLRSIASRAFIASGRAILLVFLLGAWAFISGRFAQRQFVSDPAEVLRALAELISSGTLWPNLAQTVLEVGAGYGIGAGLAILAAMALGVLETAQEVLRPFLTAIYSIPKITLAPLIIMWFGLGTAPKIILAAAFVFFVVFMNTIAGIYTISPSLIDVVRVMSAGRFALIWKVTFPSALPYLFSGLRLAIPESLLGAVVGEFISANAGLGYLVNSAVQQFNTAATLAAIMTLLLIVVVMDVSLNIAERRMLRWQTPSDGLTRNLS